MKERSVLAVLVALCLVFPLSEPAGAETYELPYGFGLTLPEGWEVDTDEELSLFSAFHQEETFLGLSVIAAKDARNGALGRFLNERTARDPQKHDGELFQFIITQYPHVARQLANKKVLAFTRAVGGKQAVCLTWFTLQEGAPIQIDMHCTPVGENIFVISTYYIVFYSKRCRALVDEVLQSCRFEAL